MSDLAPIRQELVDLRIKYVEARDDTRKAREKLLDLVESTRTDTMEIERLRKERDDAQQWIVILEGELRGKRI